MHMHTCTLNSLLVCIHVLEIYLFHEALGPKTDPIYYITVYHLCID